MFNDYNEETPQVDLIPEASRREGCALAILDRLISNFDQSYNIAGCVEYNQKALVTLINLSRMSKFRGSNDPKLRYFNVINQTVLTGARKTQISANEINLSIDDKAYNFLAQAAYREFVDDVDLDSILADFNESVGWYGTAVLKRVKRKKGNHILKVVPFTNIIWDQKKADQHPMGEMFCTSLADLENMDKFPKKKVNALVEKVKQSAGKDFDANESRVTLYEIHGYMPSEVFDKNPKKNLQWGMFVAAEVDGAGRHILYIGKEDGPVYDIFREQTLEDRSMGLGRAEIMLESQIATNEINNLILDQLRATSKVVYQTSDKELDGEDLQQIDNLTLIYHEEGSPVTQVSTQPTSYSALQNYMNTVIGLGREQASIQDFALGVGPKSNVSFAAIQSAGKEADGVYSYYKNQQFRFWRKIFKMKCGILDLIMEYFDSEKDINKLLTPYQRKQWVRFLAEYKAYLEQENQLEDDLPVIDDFDDLTDFFEPQVEKSNFIIKFDEKIDKEFIRDKMRLTLGLETDIITSRIQTLERILGLVTQAPDAFPSYNAERILKEIVELQDIVAAYGITTPLPSQSSQIGVTPTGPTVASDAGLTNSAGLVNSI